MRVAALLFAALVAVAVACGGGGGGDKKSADVFFQPENADQLAHAALPAVADLPGTGWEITGQDQESSSGPDFGELIKDEPACQNLKNLSTLSDVLGKGSDSTDQPAGHGEIEFEQSDPSALLPTSANVDIKIEKTAAEVQGSWKLVKGIFQAKETSDCFVAVFNNVFKDLGTGVDVKVSSVSASSTPPQDGASLAFALKLTIATVELDMRMEMYFWPYGNAKVSLLFLGTADNVNKELTTKVTSVVDQKLQAAEKAQK